MAYESGDDMDNENYFDSDSSESCSDNDNISENNEDKNPYLNPVWCIACITLYTPPQTGIKNIPLRGGNAILYPFPIDYFNVLCDIFLENVCKESNNYASQMSLQAQRHVFSGLYVDVTVDELKKAFMGLLFYTGTTRISHLQEDSSFI